MDALVRDGEGGVFLVGRLKQDLNHLAVQRRVPGGGIHPDWDPAGFVVSDPLALANVAAVPWTGYPPGSRGVLVVWSESQGTATGFDLRALHVRSGATLDANWPVGGLALCDVAGNQTSPVVGGGIVVWSDTRNQATSGTDLWWTLLEEAPWPVAVPTPSPGTRTGLAIRSVFPNPAGDGVHVTFAAAAGGAPLRVDLVDLRGRIVRSRSVTSGGDEVRVVVPTEGLPVGLYLVRGVQGEQSAAARVTVLR